MLYKHPLKGKLFSSTTSQQTTDKPVYYSVTSVNKDTPRTKSKHRVLFHHATQRYLN